MAELVGAVASGIIIAGLVVQIAHSVAKLKSYWNDLKEAPEDIRSLVEEIESLYLLLYEIEEDQRRNPISNILLDTTSTSRCLEHCRRGADSLKELADELNAEFDAPNRLRRKWASVMVVMKKDKRAKYKSRLETAIQLLTLSQQCYQRVRWRATSLLDSVKSGLSKAKKPARRDDYALSLPCMVLELGLEIEVLRSHSGWKFTLRPLNIVTWDSPAFEAVRDHDLTKLQALIETKQVTVNDLTELGITLLRFAAYEGDLPVCRYLLEHGADPQGAIHSLVFRPGPKGASTVQNRTLGEIARLHVEYDVEFNIDALKWCFIGDTAAFISFQKALDTPYYEYSLKERTETAMRIADRWCNNPDTFRTALSDCLEPIPLPTIKYSSPIENRTLLYSVARAMGVCVSGTVWVGFLEPITVHLPGWRDIVRELVTNGADLHAIELAYKADVQILATPLLKFFSGLFLISNDFHKRVHLWLEDLEAAGVDLLEYGRKEKELHRQMKLWKNFGAWPIEHPNLHREYHLIDFSYSSSPSDWVFYWSEHTEAFAEDSLSMIESPALDMPGMWIE